MCSGILEMVLRIGVIITCFSILGFRTTAYAEIAAWVGALLMNGITFAIKLIKKQKEDDTIID